MNTLQKGQIIDIRQMLNDVTKLGNRENDVISDNVSIDLYL